MLAAEPRDLTPRKGKLAPRWSGLGEGQGRGERGGCTEGFRAAKVLL